MGELSAERMAGLLAAALAEDDMTQAEFARRAGVSTKHVNQVLNGRVTARHAQLDYWAFVLGRRFAITLERPPAPSEA